jgi:hypothetical protein
VKNIKRHLALANKTGRMPVNNSNEAKPRYSSISKQKKFSDFKSESFSFIILNSKFIIPFSGYAAS